MKKVKSIVKVIILLIVLLMAVLFVYYKLTNKVSFAVLSNITEKSKERPLQTVQEWTNKVDVEGRETVRNFTGQNIEDVIPKRQILNSDEHYYIITKEDLRTVPSLFCSARGVFIPGYGDTLVYGNPLTDQGLQTATLTADDIPYTTIFRSVNITYNAYVKRSWVDDIFGSITPLPERLGALGGNVTYTNWEWDHGWWDGSQDDQPTISTVSVNMTEDEIIITVKCSPSKNLNTYGAPKGTYDGLKLVSPSDATLDGDTKITLKRKKDQDSVTEKIRVNVKGTWQGNSGNAFSGSNDHFYEMSVTYTNENQDPDGGNQDPDNGNQDPDNGNQDPDNGNTPETSPSDSTEEPSTPPSSDGEDITIPDGGLEDGGDDIEVGFKIVPKPGYKIKDVKVKEEGGEEQPQNIPESGGKGKIKLKKTVAPGEINETRKVIIIYELEYEDGTKWHKEKPYDINLDYSNDNIQPSGPGFEDWVHDFDPDDYVWKLIEKVKITATTSSTYAKYRLKETRDATPAEAWVLAEADKNVMKTGEDLPTFTDTNEEYTGQYPNDVFPFSEVINAKIAYARAVNEIMEYVKENNYTYGNAPFYEYDKKEINSRQLFLWASYMLGWDENTEAAGYFVATPNEVNSEGLSFGDVYTNVESGTENRMYIGEGKAFALENEEQLRGPQPADVSTGFITGIARIPTILEERETPATKYNSNIVKTADGKKVYIVGKPGEEKFVRLVDGKYYYCTCDDEYFPSNYVENAWWKVKTVGTDRTSVVLNDNALAREAKAFEQYIKQVTGQSNVRQLERNEDGTFKINYEVSMEPTDTSLVKTRFNSETNKYIVGPFKVNYLRAVTQQGEREKVSFSGISKSILVGVDSEGNELLDENGNSRLQLGKNYRFVYSNTTDPSTNYGHDIARNVFDTDEDYPYPSSGEEFYIEIDYLDDLVELSNFKFDFQYLTAGGKYEYYTGDYYEIAWEGAQDRIRGVYHMPQSVTGLGAVMETDGGNGGTGKSAPLSIFETVVDDHTHINSKYNDKDFSNIELVQSPESDTMTIILTPKGSGDLTGDISKIERTEGREFGIYEDHPVTSQISVNYEVKDGKIWITVDRPRKYGAETYLYDISYNMTIGGKSKEGNVLVETIINNALLPDNTNLIADRPVNTKKIPGDPLTQLFFQGYIEDKTPVTFETHLPNESDDAVYYILLENSEDGNTAIAKYEHFDPYVTLNNDYSYRRTGLKRQKDDFELDRKLTYAMQIGLGDIFLSPLSGFGAERKDTEVFKMGKLAIGPRYGISTVSYECNAGDEVPFWNAYKDVIVTRNNYKNETSPVEVSVDKTSGKLITSLIERNTHKDKNEPVEFIISDADGNEVILKVRWENKGENPGENPGDEPGEKPSENPGEKPSENPGEKPSENPGEKPSENPGEKPSENPGEKPSENPGEKPSENPGERPSENPGERPSENPGERPSENPGENPSENPGENPSENPGENPSENPGENPEPGGEEPENPVNPSEPDEATYGFYLVMKSITKKTAQDLINAIGEHPIYNIDAGIGLSDTPSGSPVEMEMFSQNINLRTSMSGYVWMDNDEEGSGLGVYNRGEAMAQEGTVEIVIWKVKYEKDGDSLTEVERTKAIGWNERQTAETVDFENNRLYIDNNGKYKVPEIQVPSVEGNDGSKYFYAYDVEFIYDGQNYEATEFLKSTGKTTLEEKIEEFHKTAEETKGPEKDYSIYSNNSYAVENKEERHEFDKKFTEIYGGNPVDDNMNTEGYATDGENELDLSYRGQLDGRIENHTIESILDTLDEQNHVLDKYRLSARVSEGGLLLPYEYLYHAEREYYDNFVFQNADYKPVSEYFNQINLGLLERKVCDMSVTKDVYSTKLVVNDVETDITYNKHGDLIKKMLILQESVPENQTSYRIDLYNSDYYYRSDVYNNIEDKITKEIVTAIKQGTELRAFITYRIAIHNGAKYSNLSINEFKDYYDDTLTLVTEPVEAQVRETTKRRVPEEETTEGEEEATDDEEETPNEEEPEEKDYYFGELMRKVVADVPHYRKLAQTESYTDLYNFNWEDDKKSSAVQEGGTGEIIFEEDSSGDNYNVIKSSTLRALSADYQSIDENMTIKPGEIYEIFVTYEVDKDTYDNIQTLKDFEEAQKIERTDLIGSKNNIAEISRYSTQYIGEVRTCTSSYEPGWVSGGIDTDSAPDNFNTSILEHVDVANTAADNIVSELDESIESNKEEAKQAMPKFFDDDTGVAPVMKLNVRKTTSSRNINGVVWDDGEEKDADNVYTGDDTGVKDAVVTMVEKIRVRASDLKDLADILNNNDITKALSTYNLSDLDYEFDYIWPDNAFKAGEKNVSSMNTGDEGEYSIDNYIAGNFVVRFDYGANEENTKYNGQDYKNVHYMKHGNGSLKNVAETSAYYIDGTRDAPGEAVLNNEWHNLKDSRINGRIRYSDARDYEPRRLQVMAYSKIVANNNAEVLAAYVNEKQNNKLQDDYKEKLKENTPELIKNTSMTANTAKLDVEIEHPKSIKFGYVKTTSGSTGTAAVKKYKVDSIDFGINRRPETKINIQDEINEIMLYKNDGTAPIMRILMDEEGNIIRSYDDLVRDEEKDEEASLSNEEVPDAADPATGSGEATNGEQPNGGTPPEGGADPTEEPTSKPQLDIYRLRKITDIHKKQLALGSQGFKYIAIEPNYLIGMTIGMKYKIKVFNNSDVDYTSYTVQKMQTPEELYEAAYRLESDKTYITGNDITYGTYVGLYYYTGEIAMMEEDGEPEEGNPDLPEPPLNLNDADTISGVIENKVGAADSITGTSWTMSGNDSLKVSTINLTMDDDNIYIEIEITSNDSHITPGSAKLDEPGGTVEGTGGHRKIIIPRDKGKTEEHETIKLAITGEWLSGSGNHTAYVNSSATMKITYTNNKEEPEKPSGETPPGEKPSGETPPGETPPGETPPGETPPGETPPGETPPGETPPGETPPGRTPPAKVKKEQLEKYGSDKYDPDYIVTTTIVQVTDYIDSKVSRRFDEDSGKTIDMAWDDSTDKDLLSKVSQMAFTAESGTATKTGENLKDSNDVALITTGGNNLQLSTNELLEKDIKDLETKELVKYKYCVYGTAKAESENNLTKVKDTTKLVKLYTLIDETARNNKESSEYNIDLTKELLPKKANDLSYKPTDATDSKAQVFINILELATRENINNMNYNNMAEIMVYSNSVGRRDMETIPGNAYSLVKEAPVYMVGFNVYVDPIIDEGIAEKTFDRITEDYTLAKEIDIDGKTHTFKVAMERDQYAARDTVTFSEPTGLLVKRALIRNIINMIAIVVMIIVITGTSTVVYRKTKSMHKNTKKAEDNGKK